MIYAACKGGILYTFNSINGICKVLYRKETLFVGIILVCAIQITVFCVHNLCYNNTAF